MSTRLNTDLDAEVEVLRTERDTLKVKLEMLQGILDNQRSQHPNAQLEFENSRLMQLIAELRQKLSDMQEEHASANERLSAQARAAKAEAQSHKQFTNQTHTNVLLKLSDTVTLAENLQNFLEKATAEAAQMKAASESRYRALVLNFSQLEMWEMETQRLLDAQKIKTREAGEECTRLKVDMKDMEACSKELAVKLVGAETNIQQLGALLEKACKKLAVFVAGHNNGHEALESEIARLLLQIQNATLELEIAQQSLADKGKIVENLSHELAHLAPNLKKALAAAENAEKEKIKAEEELKRERDSRNRALKQVKILKT